MAARTTRLIAFLATAPLCASQAASIDGSGTTNPSKFFWKIMDMFQAQSRSNIKLTYRAVGSGTGQKEFSQKAEGDFSGPISDFGAGDIPMSQELYDNITAASREMVHVPFCLGAIGIFHSVPTGEVGNEGLKLSPCVLARIFDGQITTWNDPAITADNPELSVPAGTKIMVGHRRLGSSSTGGLTGYLGAKCPASWSRGSGSKITWPDMDNFMEVEGSPGMLAHLTGVSYAIGYIDAGHGHQRALPEVRLRNEANTWLTSSDSIAAVDGNGNNGVAAAGDAAVSAGGIPIVTADWSQVNLYGKAGANTWPIVLVSYIYLPKNISGWAADKAGLLKAFVDYVTGAAGQAMLPEFSFNAIPAAMNEWSDTWTSVLQKPASVTAFSFENSTSAWAGQAETMISVKRNSYAMWKLNELDVAVRSATERLETIESSLNDYGIVPLHGSGTTNPKNWFAKAMKLMESRARLPLMLTYRAVGSGTGQKEFVGDSASSYRPYNHFGAGDIPMSASNFGTLGQAAPARTMVHLPFALGAIGVFHNVPASEVGAAALKADACLLAKIFSGQITTWDHADIKAQNPDISVPANQKIMVGRRTLGSSSTGGITGYLNKKCPDSWDLDTGSTVEWPTHSNFVKVQGSPGMQAHIKDTPYSIGYLDAGHGHDFDFSEVALTNQAGASRTSKEAIALGGVADAGSEGVSSNVFPANPSADWSAVNLYDMPGQNTWPIVLVSYLYVDKDQSGTNAKTASALQAFVDFVLNNREGLCEEFGFTAPSQELKTLSLNAAATIVYPAGMPSFTFESSTDAYNGMGELVISAKRHSFDDYERSVLADSIQQLKDRPAPPEPQQPAPVETGENTGSALALGLSIASFVISLLALCMAARAWARLRKKGGYQKEGQLANATTYGAQAQS